jgi:hypothetical protein
MDLAEGQITAAGVDLDLSAYSVGRDVAAGSIEIEVKTRRHLDRIMPLGLEWPVIRQICLPNDSCLRIARTITVVAFGADGDRRGREVFLLLFLR